MIVISTIFLLFVLSISNARTTFNQNCPNDSINFETKIENSSFVIYGKSTGKTLYPGNDSMFYITFQVECIFKGPIIPREINITQAGKIEFSIKYLLKLYFKVKLKVKHIAKIFLLVEVIQSLFLNHIHWI